MYPDNLTLNVVVNPGKSVEQVFFVCTGAAQDLPRFEICHQVRCGNDSVKRSESILCPLQTMLHETCMASEQ